MPPPLGRRHHKSAGCALARSSLSRLLPPARNTKVDVYAATAQQGQGPGAAVAPASWEFMQYISPLAQEPRGRLRLRANTGRERKRRMRRGVQGQR